MTKIFNLRRILSEKPADFPTSTITCVVGFTAGGGVDTAARLLLKYAQKYIDVPIVVNNVTGAAGAVAVTQSLAKKADGTTLISIASGAILGDITGAVSYNFLEDLKMVSIQDMVPYALVFRADDTRFSTPQEFLAYVKANPNELTVATSGVNNANYFAAKSFFEDNGMAVDIIPFNGSADAKTGFLGGHVDLFCETLLETIQMAKDGSAKFVCTFGDEPYVEGVATNKDLGLKMSVTGTFRGYAYKTGTSQAVIDYLSAIFKVCEEDPNFIAECANLGLDKCINYLNPAQAAEFMKGQYDSYTEFCKQLGIAK
ncbi:MAG: tripartite tricarboxylate transporter substrate binding protein [Synergistaceae bacterium]|nr:tripartite tricarboxylate transporter substrate binding protein [Synergistaceae bacterium]